MVVDRKWERVLSVWRSPRSWLTFHSFLKCNGILWRRHALDYTSTGSGIIPKKKHIFLVLPYSFSTLHVTYLLLSILNVYLDILIPYICLERKWWFGRKKTSHCLSQVLFNEVKEPKKLIVMDQFYTWPISRATSTKRYLSGLEASKTGPPQTLCEIEMDKEDAP